jgi:hypothetical protein
MIPGTQKVSPRSDGGRVCSEGSVGDVEVDEVREGDKEVSDFLERVSLDVDARESGAKEANVGKVDWAPDGLWPSTEETLWQRCSPAVRALRNARGGDKLNTLVTTNED